MYERFTDRARKVMELAQEEARRRRHEYVGTEHILTALALEGEGVAANALKNCGVDLVAFRKEAEAITGTGTADDMIFMGRLPLTPRTKRVIEFAIDEARNLNHRYVGTEHVLLGLLDEYEGVAVQVLTNLGATLEKVRDEVLQILGLHPDADGWVESDVFSDKAEDAFRRAMDLNETDYAWLMRRLQKRRPLK